MGRRRLPKGRRRWRLVRRGLYVLAFGFGALCVAVGIMYSRTKLPPVNAAARAQSSTFTYRDGSTLAQVGQLNRVAVPLRDVPPYVRGAVLAAEERGFYHDPVVSPSGLARASWAAVSGGDTQGGSGITQQYVKVAYLNPEQTMSRKVKELFIAVKLSRARSKDWILEQYLNTVYFGRGAYGIQAASQAYFRKNAGALTPAEGALLAGLIQAPSYLDPALGHTAETRARWRYVINGMMSTGVLPRGPLPAFPSIAPAHTEPMYAGQRGYLIERVIAELHDHGFDDDQIYRRGLRVTTTIDPRTQAALPEEVARATGTDRDLEVGVASVRPGTGEILAAYGGRDYLTHQYDNAFLAALPPGSSFSPFVLATGLRAGIGLRSTFAATPAGSVVNDGDAQVASADLLTATTRSYATVFSRLGAKVGASGATRAGLPGRLPPSGVHAVDQAAAYAALVNGTYAAPHILAKVTDRSGKALLTVRPRTRAAFPPAVAADVTFALQMALLYDGKKGPRQVVPGRPAAGTIGTTDHNAAGWFCGYTPDISTAVVVYRASNRPVVNIGDAPQRSSADVPAEIWRSVTESAESGLPVRPLPGPAWVGSTRRFAPPTPTPTPSTPPPAPASPAPPRQTAQQKKAAAKAKASAGAAGRPTDRATAAKTPLPGASK
ncbi:transglycosylase domain-containing protein [Actinoallomurus oryzae]|uniref:Transglycosylase domain-containing protein n=1 Tax=Actinoallomurus oryzae TaxID=502180 RepID=A0ABP8R7Y4_9ACTN